MLNYWWVTRPKRRLDSVPEVLSIVAETIMNQEWVSNRDLHLVFEDTLEYDNLKRGGDRRDHTGGGGRTYMAWLISLGLVFRQTATNKIMLTLAGEAILNGANPVKVLTGQMGVARAYAEHRFTLKGDIGVTMGLVRMIDIAEAYLFPRIMTKRILRSVPYKEKSTLTIYRKVFIGV